MVKNSKNKGMPKALSLSDVVRDTVQHVTGNAPHVRAQLVTPSLEQLRFKKNCCQLGSRVFSLENQNQISDCLAANGTFSVY